MARFSILALALSALALAAGIPFDAGVVSRVILGIVGVFCLYGALGPADNWILDELRSSRRVRWGAALVVPSASVLALGFRGVVPLNQPVSIGLGLALFAGLMLWFAEVP